MASAVSGFNRQHVPFWGSDVPSSEQEGVRSPSVSRSVSQSSVNIPAFWPQPGFSGAEVASLHSPTYHKQIPSHVLRKAGMDCHKEGDEGAVKKTSLAAATSRLLNGARSKDLHEKAYVQGMALASARVLKRCFRGEQNTRWGGVSAALKRFDYIFDKSAQEILKPVNCSKVEQWTSAGCWASRLLRLSHVFTGLCEMNSAPHGFYSRLIQNIADRKAAATSARFAFLNALITGVLGILVATLYTTTRSGVDVSFFGEWFGFPLLSAFFGGAAFVTKILSIPFIAAAKIDFESEASNQLKKSLVQQTQNELFEIDALFKTMAYNLVEQYPDLKTTHQQPNFAQLLQKQRKQQGNAYRTLCKAMQRKDDGFQIRNLGRSTDVRDIDILEAVRQDYFNPQSPLYFTNVDAGRRIDELGRLMGQYLHNGLAASEKSTTSTLRAWIDAKANKRASLARENEYVFLRELAAVSKPFSAVQKDMTDAQKDFLSKHEKAAVDMKDLRIRIEEWGKRFNKTILLTLSKLCSGLGAKGLATYFADHADDVRAAQWLAYKRERFIHYAHHTDVMVDNPYAYTNTIQRLLNAAEGTRSFNFNCVLATNAQSSRGYAAFFRWSYRKITGRLPSIVLCTHLGRLLGGLQVVLFTCGLSAAAQAIGVGVKYAIPRVRLVFSVIITGTLMFILNGISFSLLMAAKSLVYFFPKTFIKEHSSKNKIAPDRIKGFTFKALPPGLMSQ